MNFINFLALTRCTFQDPELNKDRTVISQILQCVPIYMQVQTSLSDQLDVKYIELADSMFNRAAINYLAEK